MSTDSERPPYGWAALTAVVVFTIYLASLAPTTAFWDTSEYIAAAKVLGIPHPPGNPLFVILAHTFGLLPLASSYAVRINLFAAALAGVGVPLALKRLGIDPALAGGVVLTTVTDTVGFASLLGLGTFFLT